MGWKDAPPAPASAPKWASAPAAEPAEPEISATDAAVRGAQAGYGARLAGVGGALAAKLTDALHELNPMAPGMHEDAGEAFSQQQDTWRKEDAAARAAQPAAFIAGQMAPALASAVIPGAGTVKGAAAIGGGLGLLGSESDKPAEIAGEAATGAAASAAGAKLLQLLGRGAGALGQKVLPKVEALRDSIAAKVADRSASAAESTARSAIGTLGKQTAGGSADLKLLQALMEQGVSPETEAAIKAALAGPEAGALRESLAKNALARLPSRLADIEGGGALVQQTAADAAAARAPEALAATEKQIRRSAADVLLKRYALPAAAGAAIGEWKGGHVGGAAGLGLGLGARPMLRAILRNLTSPGFTAPASRALVSGAETLASSTGDTLPSLASLFGPPTMQERATALAQLLRNRRTDNE